MNPQIRNEGTRPTPGPEQRSKPSIAITGGAGLIGSRTVRALIPRYQIFVLDAVDWPDDPPEGVELLKVDLTHGEDVATTLRTLHRKTEGRLASCIHLAAYYDFSGADSPFYEELTVKGTRRLLRGLGDFEVEQFVFSSTLLVMEPVHRSDGALTEESPTEDEWPYPASKLAAEAVLDEEGGSMPIVSLHLAGAYDEDGHSPPLCQHIKRIYDKQLESYLFPGDESHGQPYVHLDDFVQCLECTVAARHELGRREVFLVAEPEVMSHHQLQETLGKLIHGMEWPMIRVPKTCAKAGAWLREKVLGQEMFIKPWMVDLADDHYPVTIERARTALDWQPRHRLHDVLPEMILRMQLDPEAFFQRNGVAE